MKVKAKFYVDFKKLFGDGKEVELGDQAEIKDLLTQVCDTDQRRQAILDSSGNVKPGVMIVLMRGQRSDIVDKEHAKLEDGDVVMVCRAVYGG